MRLASLLLFFACLSTVNITAQDLHFRDKPLPCVNKKLGIVVHLVQNQQGETNISEVQLAQQLAFINDAFAPICLSFEFCEVREIENWQFDTVDSMAVWDELLISYNVPSRINLYYTTSIAFAEDICGFATQGALLHPDTTAGIIIQKSCVVEGMADLAHQLGHWFGLNNTFEGDELVVRTDCEITGDSICDTPADNFIIDQPVQSYVDFFSDTCRYINQEQDREGQFYCPDVGNYMSNYALNQAPLFFIDCRCGFTADQYRRIAANCVTSRAGG